MSGYKFEKMAADTVRVLSAEIVQQAKSGHPGMPMGCADFAFMLWYKYMKHFPKNPEWIGRDRFILSAGHGSALSYSLLNIFNYDMPLEELKRFRQWDSLTPGHPEHGHTRGIEVTTGPLGSGFASGVGMAIAAKNFASRTGLDKSGLFNQKIFVLSSDGCMMEGTSHEAASIAGHLKLDNLICFYDDNSITIEGGTSLAFSENIPARFEAYGWKVIRLDDANNAEKVDLALAEAMKSDGRPVLIDGKTKIGYGSPKKAGTHSCHGEPLGDDEVAATKKALGMADNPPFFIPAELKEKVNARCAELEKYAAGWDKKLQQFLDGNPEAAKLMAQLLAKEIPADLLEQLLAAAPKDKAVATRVSGGIILNKAAQLIPAISGGAADLAPSTKTLLNGESGFSAENRKGRNFHFGVRELGMGFLANGMSLYGASIPYAATFFVFSDYMKPAIRLAAIQNLHIIYVFTHDSFYVGEDGPTHEPIEQIIMLRTIPNMTVIRPAEANEAAHAWHAALKLIKGPSALLLTRQDLEPLPPELAKKIDIARGAYILQDDENADTVIVASGSEVNLSLKSAEILRGKGLKIRVVSMPCRELFLKQDKSYREKIIPSSFKRKISVEAASTYGWKDIIGMNGLAIGIDHFGASAPYKILAEKFGFTPDAVAEKIMSI